MKIYCAGPITGKSYKEVVEYYKRTVNKLQGYGYQVLFPMCAKSYLINETNLKAGGYDYPLSTDHAIIERDRWMVMQSDVVFVNFFNAKKRISIGSCMELAWAHDHGKHTVTVMQEKNVHRHAFVSEASDVIYLDEKSAFDYLEKLAKSIV